MPIFNIISPDQSPSNFTATISTFEAPNPPIISLLKVMLEILYPKLKGLPYAISAYDGNGKLASLLGDEDAMTLLCRLHVAGNVDECPELGSLAEYDESITKHRSGKRSAWSRSGSRTARKQSGKSSPGPLSTVDPADVAERLELLQEEVRMSVDLMQARMKSAAMIRDRACVVSGQVTLDDCDAAHVLSPEYAYSFFDSASVAQHCLARVRNPSRLGRSYDVRNCLMMLKQIHAQFDQFKFSVYVKEGKTFAFVFAEDDSLLGVKHNAPLLMPTRFEGTADLEYYMKQWPCEHVLMEHFRQAVLRRCRASGQKEGKYDWEEPGEEEDVTGDVTESYDKPVRRADNQETFYDLYSAY
ncbi:hypothetical protein BC832DRAFT_588933 [Gaertneriomyces semiglobifer]|nr:hypothetical protein BC832DRAFT_588933 [Gaertneriomyces semiglobifer]